MDKNIKTIKKVKENYINLNKTMISQLDLMSTHGTLTGSSREEMWLDFFRKIVPEKFNISQGVIIIDSNGEVSKEVDIAIYDSSYTPYVFNYNSLKFIPIEAVAVVIECKSKKLETNSLKKWIKSIDNLVPSSIGLARMATNYCISATSKTQRKTKPLKVLVSLKEYEDEKNQLNSVIKEITDNGNKLKDSDKRFFDFAIYKDTGNKDSIFRIKVRNENMELGYWADYLNGTNNDKIEIPYLKKGDYEPLKINSSNGYLKNTLKDLRVDENPFLTINFQLNQLLMLLNNPMLFPHFSYANMFNDKKYKDKE